MSDTPADDIIAAYKWSTDLETFHNDGDDADGTTVIFVPGNASGGMVDVTASISGVLPDRFFIKLAIEQL